MSTDFSGPLEYRQKFAKDIRLVMAANGATGVIVALIEYFSVSTEGRIDTSPYTLLMISSIIVSLGCLLYSRTTEYRTAVNWALFFGAIPYIAVGLIAAWTIALLLIG